MKQILSRPLPRARVRHRRPHGAPNPGAAAPRAGSRIDPAVQRVREAGGPIDRASYGCRCGYAFRAPVTTTVSCPHCGATQAW